MARERPKNPQAEHGANTGTSGATTGYEADLWRMADTLRGSIDAAEYKHIVLGLIFLKYISDSFEERYTLLESERKQGTDPEDPDEYRAENIFWVPPEARWTHLKVQARQPTIGQLVDEAMAGIERDNPALKDVLPKDYARAVLDKQRLGQIIDLISNIRVGDAEARSKDVLGRVYEYFLSQFASAEGKKGGEFYTPRCIVKLLVEMLEPFSGRVYDPCCGSSGMFVQSVTDTPRSLNPSSWCTSSVRTRTSTDSPVSGSDAIRLAATSAPAPVSASPPSRLSPTSRLGPERDAVSEDVAPRGLERCPHTRHHRFGPSQSACRTLHCLATRADPQRVRLERQPEPPRTGVHQIAPHASGQHRHREPALESNGSRERRW